MSQTFPTMIKPDEETRAGRMMAAGDVRVTVTNVQEGEHITIRFKAMLDNREHVRSEDRNWVRVPLNEATHVFIEVPSATGDFPDKIGTFYPRTGRFFSDRNADVDRVSAATLATQWLNGDQITISAKEWPYVKKATKKDLKFQEESYCGICGRTLTDPESIDIGIGPECAKKSTSSKHQSKTKLSFDEKALVDEIMSAIRDLSDAAQKKIMRELNMWFSQER